MKNWNAGVVLLVATVLISLFTLALGYLPVAESLRAMQSQAARGGASQGALSIVGLVKPLLLMGAFAGMTLLVVNMSNAWQRRRKTSPLDTAPGR